MMLQKEINVARLIMDLFNVDLFKIKQQTIYEIDEVTFHEFKVAAAGDDINAILLIINRLFKEASESLKTDDIIFLSYFLYRYIYFYRTLADWEKHFNKLKEISNDNPGKIFLEYIAPFFNEQIGSFIQNYESYLVSLEVEKMNHKLSKKINALIKDIKEVDDFEIKLVNVENLVRYFQNSKNLIGLLEGASNENKETFLTLTNEIKVDFQSMNHLIVEILRKIRGMRVD